MALSLTRATILLCKTNKCYVKTLPSIPRQLYLNRDWQPGPYPETEEERLAAAKKYLMLPEEYEPYPRDKYFPGIEYGDYPHLPFIHFDQRDPYEPWTYMHHRKDYKDPVHIHQAGMGLDITPLNKPRPTFGKIMFHIIGVWAVFLFLFYLGEKVKYYPRIMKKHTPADGDHYYYPETKH